MLSKFYNDVYTVFQGVKKMQIGKGMSEAVLSVLLPTGDTSKYFWYYTD